MSPAFYISGNEFIDHARFAVLAYLAFLQKAHDCKAELGFGKAADSKEFVISIFAACTHS